MNDFEVKSIDEVLAEIRELSHDERQDLILFLREHVSATTELLDTEDVTGFVKQLFTQENSLVQDIINYLEKSSG